MQTIGLVRVTVATPQRRIDVALPERSSVAELVPGLLGHAGEHLADGGWSLRRADGAELELGRTLGSYRIRDGEILHLAPRRTEWPELEYDDLVDAIADGASRAGRAWGARHTRLAGLAAGAAGILLGLAAVIHSGPPWSDAALWSLGLAVLLLTAGFVLARAAGDAVAGSVLGALALPYAFAGGLLLLAGDRPLTGLGAPQLQAGCAALLLAAVLGYVGIAWGITVFAGAMSVGLFGVAGAWLATLDSLEGHEAAVIIAGALLAFSPAFAPLAIRLGRVPTPVLPRTTADLVRDDPQPGRPMVYDAVVRAHGLLTGLLLGTGVVVVACEILLVRSGDTSALVLTIVLALGFLLRARLYPVLWQRIPMLTAGLAGTACLALWPLMSDRPLVVAGPIVVAAGGLMMLAGLAHSKRTPSPRLGRYAELLEVLVVLAIVPVACSVLGLYGYVRGLGG